MPPLSNVLVYFPINTAIDPSGVQVFGETVTTSDRIINCEVTVALSNILPFFRYQEDPSNRDNTVVTTVSANDGEFVSNLANSLNGNADLDMGSLTAWWPNLAGKPYYGNQSNAMYHYTSVYEVLLSQIANDLFGHPLAKAGIANDNEILAYFQSQNLARLLVNDIENSSNLRVVYQQMVEQAPLRFNTQDSAAGTNGVNGTLPVPLPFQEGDTIRFEITLASYNVGLFGGAVDSINSGYSVTKQLGMSSNYGSNTYTVNIMIGSNPTSSSIIQSGLLVDLESANYMGGATWLDSSPNNNNATLAAGAGILSNGYVYFNGATNFTLANLGFLPNWTLSIWYKPPSTFTSTVLVFGEEYNNNQNYSIVMDDGKYLGCIANSTPFNGSNTILPSSNWNDYIVAYEGPSTTLNEGIWNNFVVTYDGTTMKNYLNKTVIGTSNLSVTPISSGQPICVGGGDVFGNYITGLFGEALIYNRALSANEVTSNYNATSNYYM